MGKATRLLDVALSAPTLPRLRRVSENVSLTPRSPVAGYVASVNLAYHVCPCAPRGDGGWVSRSGRRAPASDAIACGAQEGN
eukprot:5328065-Pleurochrysis_carterae.AAC.1